MKHRGEIDGLRAVAVLPVVLFHAGFAGFAGGFVGVDVFFVISGYLITGILLEEMRSGRYSILDFYERRARRILPALTVVMLATLPLAWAWMPPDLLRDHAQALAAVTLFASNILFWREEGYFTAAADEKPLLHTWSLAVEEQFYLLFPILLLLAVRRLAGWRLAAALAGCGVASLVASEWMVRSMPGAAFYLLPSRAWELLAGALCALVPAGRLGRSGAAAAAGIGLIAASMVLLDGETPFPGLAAVPVVLGTCLVILGAGPGNAAGRILASRPAVGIGLLSYSAYLWHQPLFAFARLRSDDAPSALLMLGLAVLAFLLAWATWALVEQPFRRRGPRAAVSRRAVWALSALAGAAFIGIGGAGHLGQGFPERQSPTGLVFADLGRRLQHNYGLAPDCDGGFPLRPACATGMPEEVLLWGDSFAMHLAPALMAEDPGLKLRQITASSCAPVPGVAVLEGRSPEAGARDCIAFNDRVLDWIAAAPGLRQVVLSSPFGIAHAPVMTRDGQRLSGEAATGAAEAALAGTVAGLRAAGLQVTIVAPPPRTGRDFGRCLAVEAAFTGGHGGCDFAESTIDARSRTAWAFLDRVSARSGAGVLRLDPLLCEDGRCRTLLGDAFVYRDTGHLSVEGARALGRSAGFAAAMEGLAR